MQINQCSNFSRCKTWTLKKSEPCDCWAGPPSRVQAPGGSMVRHVASPCHLGMLWLFAPHLKEKEKEGKGEWLFEGCSLPAASWACSREHGMEGWVCFLQICPNPPSPSSEGDGRLDWAEAKEKEGGGGGRSHTAKDEGLAHLSTGPLRKHGMQM